MKKICKLLLLFLCVSGACHAQVEAYLYDNVGNYTNIRYSPKGEIKTQLKGKSTIDTSFRLTAPLDGWWKIVSCYNYETGNNISSVRGGYIHSSCLAVSTRNYSGEHLFIRSTPNPKGKVVYVVKMEEQFRPIDISENGHWVKVKSMNGKHIGWIEAEMLCGNPVTNCC